MAQKRPTTVSEYIRAAPSKAQPHVRRVHAILESVAPKAQQVIKWGNPFFVEPRFLFAYSVHRAHMSLAPTAGAMIAFRTELKKYQSTKCLLKLPYDEPLPESLIRRIAQHCVHEVRQRNDDGFWAAKG